VAKKNVETKKINSLFKKVQLLNELMSHLEKARRVAYDSKIRRYDIADTLTVQIGKLYDDIKKDESKLSKLLTPKTGIWSQI
jgi:hypothetical protein